MSHCVYRIYDADGQLLYIGATSNLRERMRRLTAARDIANSPHPELVSRMARVESVEYPTRPAAFAAERAAIAAENPPLNIQSRRHTRKAVA